MIELSPCSLCQTPENCKANFLIAAADRRDINETDMQADLDEIKQSSISRNIAVTALCRRQAEVGCGYNRMDITDILMAMDEGYIQ